MVCKKLAKRPERFLLPQDCPGQSVLPETTSLEAKTLRRTCCASPLDLGATGGGGGGGSGGMGFVQGGADDVLGGIVAVSQEDGMAVGK